MHHIYHAFTTHFTTKTPQQNTHFRQNPSKNGYLLPEKIMS